MSNFEPDTISLSNKSSGKTRPKAAKARPPKNRSTVSKGSKGRPSWDLAHTETPDRYGFYKLKNTQLRTMEERQYEEILTDDVKWGELRARMDADFAHQLEMFPFDERPDKREVNPNNLIETLSDTIGNWLKSTAQTLGLTDIDLPRRYFFITRADIEQRFPGGRVTGEPGDGDIRDLLTAFRRVFRENLARYIGKKRFYQFMAVLAFSLVVAVLLSMRGRWDQWLSDAFIGIGNLFAASEAPGGASVPYVGLVTPFLLCGAFLLLHRFLYYFYSRESEILFNVYNNTQTESCKTLDKQAALRTKNLANLIVTMAARIDKDQSHLMSSGQPQDWPERSYRWLMVVYWTGRRLENLERYTQLQIWLVRRTHYFYRLVAASSNYAVNVLCLLLIAVLSAGVGLVASGTGVDLRKVNTQYLVPLRDQAGDMIERWTSNLSVETAISFTRLQDAPSGIEGFLATLWREINLKGLDVAQHGLYAAACLFGLFLALHFVAKVSRRSAKDWNTSLSLIQQNLDVHNWDRYHSVQLHEVLARQVRSDKNYILQRETWVGGRPR